MFKSISIFVLLFLLVLPFAVNAQSDDIPQIVVVETTPADIPEPAPSPEAIFLALSALVTPLVTLAKGGLLDQLKKRRSWNDETYAYSVRLVSIGFGILVAIIAGDQANLAHVLNLYDVPGVFGIIAGGVLIGFGSNWIHELFKLWRSASEWFKQKLPDLTPRHAF